MNYETQRLLICELGRRMWSRGWVAANDGNLSRRLGEGLFLVTPAGASKGFLTPEMLLVVNGQGELVEGSSYHPSSETPLHLECYRRRSEVNGVCHAHPPASTAFACCRMGLEAPILGEMLMTLGEIPCAPYAASGTPELPAAAGPYLERYDAVLLSNHGVLTLGLDLEQAYWYMETVEHTAQIHLNARQLGGGVPLSNREVEQISRHPRPSAQYLSP